MTTATCELLVGRSLARDGSNYMTEWSAANAEYVSTGEIANMYFAGAYLIARTFLYFNTISIPTSAIISSATIYMLMEYQGTEPTGVFQSGQPTYPRYPCAVGDYNQSYYSGNGGTVDFGGVQNTVLPFALNSTGIGWINQGGVTKLCLRHAGDISHTQPSSQSTMWLIPSHLSVVYSNYEPHIWIEGTDFKYITSTGVEKSITGTLV